MNAQYVKLKKANSWTEILHCQGSFTKDILPNLGSGTFSHHVNCQNSQTLLIANDKWQVIFSKHRVLSTSKLKNISPQAYFAKSLRSSCMTKHDSNPLGCWKNDLDTRSSNVKGIVENFQLPTTKLYSPCQSF